MHIVAQQFSIQLVHVRIVGEHDVAGEVERESLVLDRATPAPDRGIALQYQAILAQVVTGAKAGRPRSKNDGGIFGRTRLSRDASGRMADLPATAVRIALGVGKNSGCRRGAGAGAFDQLLHLRGGPIPGRRLYRAAHVLGATCTLLRRGIQCSFACRDKRCSVIRDIDDFAIRPDHIGNRCTDDRTLCGHVFQRLGGTDEARGLIHRKGLQAYVPTREELRQLGIGALTEVVDVRLPRQALRVDFRDRSHHYQLPVGPCVGHTCNKVEVDAFIDHAKETQARMCDGALFRMIERGRASLSKMHGIHAARKAMHCRMPIAFGAIQARPAGKHHVGELQQGTLPLQQLLGRIAKRRQFVHAVVDDGVRRELVHQRQRHGRVEPDSIIADLFLLQQLREQLLQHRDLLIVKTLRCYGGMGTAHSHVRRRFIHLQRHTARPRHRLFEKVDFIFLGQPSEQVLGSLKNEVPA